MFGDDPAFRLAVSDRAGTTPLGGRGALASQPTLSRLVSALSGKRNMGVLRAGLARFAGWRLRAMNGGRLPKRLVIDIDSLPVEVHGAQPGSEWNGHYHARIHHPLIASVGETGDLVDARLRKGRVHTADGGLDFITEVLDRAERHLDLSSTGEIQRRGHWSPEFTVTEQAGGAFCCPRVGFGEPLLPYDKST